MSEVDEIDRELFAKGQPDTLRELADYAEESGAHTKANMLRGLADDMELYRPVIKGFLEVKQGDFSRENLDEAIKKWEEHFDYEP